MPAVKVDSRIYEELVIKRVDEPIVSLTGLEIPAHDYISLAYTEGNLTGVTYRLGGQEGTPVATLALSYDASGNLISVGKN